MGVVPVVRLIMLATVVFKITEGESMLKKLFLGCAAAALAALPAWADDASANGARSGRRVPVWQSQEDGTLQPDATYGGGSSQWNSPTSSDGQTRMNSRMAERLRAARRTTSAS